MRLVGFTASGDEGHRSHNQTIKARLAGNMTGRYHPHPGPSPRIVFGQANGDNNNFRPSSADIILGRGKCFEHHNGNVRLQRIVEGLMPNFIFAQRGGKKLVVQRVLNQINEEGRRFLKQIRAGTVRNWEEVDHEIAFEKVAQVSRVLSHRPSWCANSKRCDVQALQGCHEKESFRHGAHRLLIHR